jgi:hypothetical protein
MAGPAKGHLAVPQASAHSALPDEVLLLGADACCVVTTPWAALGSPSAEGNAGAGEMPRPPFCHPAH